jgi:predicted dehydrogenase
MRALIIGFGSIGRRHARNLTFLRPSLELILLRRSAISDDVPKGARIVSDLASALALLPDFAVIATPTHLHSDVLIPLLRAGIPCYIEKPVVANDNQLSDLARTLKTLDEVPVTLVGCNLRFLPSLKMLKTLAGDGTIGRVVRANLVVGQWLPDWRPSQDYHQSYSARPELGGGVILDLIHEIDQARWLFGEYESIFAIGGKFSSLDINTEDTACILLGNRGRAPVVSISLDYVSRKKVRRYEIVGDQGSLIWDLNERSLHLHTEAGSELLDCGPDGYDTQQTYIQAMSEFLACIEGGEHILAPDIIDGLKSTELALRARKAALS